MHATWCVAACCIVVQSVAMCCKVLQCVAVCLIDSLSCHVHSFVITYKIRLHRCVLQCVAVCRSVLQCFAACCSVLQRVVVRLIDSLSCRVHS